jgi:DNA-binding transcriptional MocR family regulator
MSRYQELATTTEKLIADGLLRPGDRLPSIRQACQTHKISPITVSSAYQLLESRSLIEARPKSGYFVRARLGQKLSEPAMSQPGSGSTGLAVSDFIFRTLDSIKDSSVVPLGSSFPAPELFPLDLLGRSLASAARQLSAQDTLADLPPGNAELRRLLALRYQSHGATVSPDEIIITAGAMEGLNLCLQAVTQPGDLIAVESPTFYATLQAAERLGLKVVEIPSHPRDGLNLEALAEVLAQHPVKACLSMLNFSNPTGSLMPDERKKALIELLRQHQVPLIEDDVYAELHFGAAPPLCSKALDSDGLVMHVSSFSKCLAPGYRIGWVAAGRHVELIRRQKLTTSLATSAPIQAALASYLKQGGYDKHLRQLRRKLASQEAQMIEWVARHFPASTRVSRPQGGYFLWLELPPGCDALAVHERALAHGISTAPGPIFSAKREYSHFLRLNFGHPEDARQEAAIEQLGQLIDQQLTTPSAPIKNTTI